MAAAAAAAAAESAVESMQKLQKATIDTHFRVVMPQKRSKGDNPLTMVHFQGEKNSNIQNESAFFNFARHLLRLRPEYRLFFQSVCFASYQHQVQYKQTNLQLVKDGACVKTFYRASMARNNGTVFHVAVIEGRCHPARDALPRPPPKEYEFHSCIVVLDKYMKSIFIFNPWKIGIRPRKLSVIGDIGPNLVQRLVKLYPNKWQTFYNGGSQNNLPDCRYHSLCILKRLGGLPDCCLKKHFKWVKLD